MDDLNESSFIQLDHDEDNYPTSTSYQTLSIASLGSSTLENNKANIYHSQSLSKNYQTTQSPFRRTNDISDIDGATYHSKFEKYTNKPKYNDMIDIPGSSPKKLIRERVNKPDYTLEVDDIFGSRTRTIEHISKSTRHINPLVPTYKLPSFQTASAPEFKFIRDHMDNSDVDGAQRKTKLVSIRDILSVKDIEGAKADYRRRHEEARFTSAPHDIMRTNDVSEVTKSMFQKTKRSTDPFSPSYSINGMNIKDDDRYVKPKPFKKFIKENFLLKTSDIEGAQADYVVPRLTNRREVRNINYIQDIEGAQADTVRHTLRTNRQTNPLFPGYKSLDGEDLSHFIKPLIPPSLYTKPNFDNLATFRETLKQMEESSLRKSTQNIVVKPDIATSSIDSSKLVPFDWSSLSESKSKNQFETNISNGSSRLHTRSNSSSRYSQSSNSPIPSISCSPIVSARINTSRSNSLRPIQTSQGIRSNSVTISQKRAIESRNADIEAVRGLE